MLQKMLLEETIRAPLGPHRSRRGGGGVVGDGFLLLDTQAVVSALSAIISINEYFLVFAMFLITGCCV